MKYFDWRAAALYGAAAGLLALLVIAIALVSGKQTRHADWIRVLELRIDNLHKERERGRVQSLQLPRPTPVPPPLSEARTFWITDADLDETHRPTTPDVGSRATVPYPRPPRPTRKKDYPE